MTDGLDEGPSSSMHTNNSDMPSTSRTTQVVQEPPNRRQFERFLSRLTNEIKTNEQDLKTLLGHRSSGTSASYIPGEISKAREQSRQCRRDREQFRQEVTVSTRKIDDLKQKLFAKRHEISNVEEGYLLFKNEQKLNDHLRKYQTIYDNRQFTNIREETAIVQQIDKLHRNQKQLKKWKVLCEERDKLELELKTGRCHIQSLHGKIRESRRKEETHKDTYKQGVQAVSATKKALDDLYTQKRRLVQDYNEKRQSFIDWRRSHPAEAAAAANAEMRSAMAPANRREIPPKLKRKSSGGMHSGSYGSSRFGADDSDSDSDGGTDFELFWEEKRACRNLMSYLQRIAQSTMLCMTPSSGSHDSENQSTSTHHNTLSNASSLAEDQHVASDVNVDETIGNGNLVLLKKDSGDEAGPAPQLSEMHGRRRVSKKDKSRKPHQAMSYDPQTLSRFDSVGIKPPLTVSDVPAAIESLKETLKYFEDHTRMPPDTSSANYWFDTFGIPSHTDRMISSESEMTTDSARYSLMTPSDADDSLSVSGLLSPTYPTGEISINSSPAGILSFSTGDHEDNGPSVTTPLATTFGKTDKKMAMIAEQDGAKEIQENTLLRIPTYDEGIADLASEVISKNSSTGESNGDGAESEATEIRKKLEQLKLEKDK